MACRRQRNKKYGNIARVFRERIQAEVKIFRKTLSPFPCLSPANRYDRRTVLSSMIHLMRLGNLDFVVFIAIRHPLWADTPAEVDQVAKVVRQAGGKNIEGPKIWPDYSPGYYALFFEDPDGNKLEVCCRGSGIVAD